MQKKGGFTFLVVPAWTGHFLNFLVLGVGLTAAPRLLTKLLGLFRLLHSRSTQTSSPIKIYCCFSAVRTCSQVLEIHLNTLLFLGLVSRRRLFYLSVEDLPGLSLSE